MLMQSQISLIVTFVSQAKAKETLENVPRNIKGNLMSLEWNHQASIQEANFNWATFWVQTQNVPLEFFDVENARRLGKKIGFIMAVDIPLVNGCLLRSCIRFRVNIDISKPLPFGIWNPKQRGKEFGLILNI